MVRVKLLGKDSKRRRSDRPLASTSIYGSNKEDKKKKFDLLFDGVSIFHICSHMI